MWVNKVESIHHYLVGKNCCLHRMKTKHIPLMKFLKNKVLFNIDNLTNMYDTDFEMKLFHIG